MSATFAAYILLPPRLACGAPPEGATRCAVTPSMAFTTTTLLGMLHTPLMIMPYVVSELLNAKVSLSRLVALLCAEEAPALLRAPLPPISPLAPTAAATSPPPPTAPLMAPACGTEDEVPPLRHATFSRYLPIPPYTSLYLPISPRHILRECTVNKTYAVRFVGTLQSQLSYGIMAAQTLTEVFADNEELLEKVDDQTVLRFIDLLREQARPTLDLPCISPVPPLYLPYISPTARAGAARALRQLPRRALPVRGQVGAPHGQG